MQRDKCSGAHKDWVKVLSTRHNYLVSLSGVYLRLHVQLSPDWFGADHVAGSTNSDWLYGRDPDRLRCNVAPFVPYMFHTSSILAPH